MRKHSKFITVLLSAVLAVCLLQTVFVQAFATEVNDDDYSYGDVATDDEPEESLYPVSMKVVKAPKSVYVSDGEITDTEFWKNVVLHIVYSDGQEFDVNCDGIDSDYGIPTPIEKINNGEGSLTYRALFSENGTVEFHIICAYTYESEPVCNNVDVLFSAEKKADPHAIVKCEVTKLPNKVFTEPLYTCSFNDIMANNMELALSLDAKKSISHNIDGLEITFYYANGEKGGTVTFDSSMMVYGAPWFVAYSAKNVDEYGNSVDVNVRDEGNYKFTVFFGYNDNDGITYTAKSVDNPNPSIKPVSTEDTPSKPAKPSDNGVNSSTSDNATKDSANRANGTANNGVVATGDFATPAIIAVVMIAAAAVMFVLKRKQTL